MLRAGRRFSPDLLMMSSTRTRIWPGIKRGRCVRALGSVRGYVLVFMRLLWARSVDPSRYSTCEYLVAEFFARANFGECF